MCLSPSSIAYSCLQPQTKHPTNIIRCVWMVLTPLIPNLWQASTLPTSCATWANYCRLLNTLEEEGRLGRKLYIYIYMPPLLDLFFPNLPFSVSYHCIRRVCKVSPSFLRLTYRYLWKQKQTCKARVRSKALAASTQNGKVSLANAFVSINASTAFSSVSNS